MIQLTNNETVVYIGGFELPDKNAAAQRVLNNSKCLRELGYDVVLIGISNSVISRNIVDTVEFYEGFCCYKVEYPKTIFQWVKYLTCIKEYIQILKTLYNVKAVILYNFPAVAMARLMYYCNKDKIQCYADVTEWYSAKGRGASYYIIKSIDTYIRMVILHKHMDGLIVISTFLQSYYKRHVNTIMIPALTDGNYYCKYRHSFKSKDKLKLVYAGNPGSKDKINIIVEALKNVKRNYSLDVLGIDFSSYIKSNRDHKAFLINEKNRIHFHGRVPHDKAVKCVSSANYSIFFREDNLVSRAGFPSKLAEALSCGTPVITNKTSDIDKYIKNGQNGFLIDSVAINDIAELLNRIPLSIFVNYEIFDYKNYTADFRRIIGE